MLLRKKQKEQTPISEWQKPAENLPQSYDPVLVYGLSYPGEPPQMLVGYYRERNKTWSVRNAAGTDVTVRTILAWRKFPPPPKGI